MGGLCSEGGRRRKSPRALRRALCERHDRSGLGHHIAAALGSPPPRDHLPHTQPSKANLP